MDLKCNNCGALKFEEHRCLIKNWQYSKHVLKLNISWLVKNISHEIIDWKSFTNILLRPWSTKHRTWTTKTFSFLGVVAPWNKNPFNPLREGVYGVSQIQFLVRPFGVGIEFSKWRILQAHMAFFSGTRYEGWIYIKIQDWSHWIGSIMMKTLTKCRTPRGFLKYCSSLLRITPRTKWHEHAPFHAMSFWASAMPPANTHTHKYMHRYRDTYVHWLYAM